MSEIQRIADQLRRAHEGEAWHGPSLEEILGDILADVALFRTKPNSHCIWEILLHIGVWESVVRRRLSGEIVTKIAADEDWPVIGDSSESSWKNDNDQIRRGHELLQQAIGRLSDRQLEEPVPGMGYNVYSMLHGVVQHTLYHAGQIATLKRLRS